MESKTINERIESYKKYREEHGFPQFEPTNGICWNCRKQIYEVYDGTQPITGCPHCHRSFVD